MPAIAGQLKGSDLAHRFLHYYNYTYLDLQNSRALPVRPRTYGNALLCRCHLHPVVQLNRQRHVQLLSFLSKNIRFNSIGCAPAL